MKEMNFQVKIDLPGLSVGMIENQDMKSKNQGKG